jgi:hypothetical protein
MKKIFILFNVLFLITSSYSQSKISGVVTYYFNEYQGNKADLGATVIFIDSIKNPKFNYSLYEKYVSATRYMKIISNYNSVKTNSQTLFDYQENNYKKTLNKKKYLEANNLAKKKMDEANVSILDSEKYIKEYTEKLIQYDSETLEKFTKLITENYLNLLKLNDDLPTKTVDASGNYSISLTPSTYYVLIRSKNRSVKYNLLEGDGKIFLKKIKLKNLSEKDVSVNFEI